MKKAWAAIVLIIVTGQQGLWANYRTILADRLNFEDLPERSEQTLDSDYRLRGMGYLSLPIQDESNYLGTYKYADFAAGIPLDYHWGKVELSYLKDAGTVEDKSSGASAFTGDYADADSSSYNIMTHMPFDYGRIGRGGLVLSKKWHYSDIDVMGSAAGAFNPTMDEASVRDFTAAYGHRFGCGFLSGLSVEHTLDRVKSQVGNSKDDLQTLTTEFSPSVGYLWNLPQDRRVTFVGGPRFIRMEDRNSPGNSEADIDGTKVGFGALFEQSTYLKLGAFYDSGELSGDLDLNGNRVGSQDLDRSKYQIRGYYQIPQGPLGFGLLYEGTDRNVKEENNAGATTGDDDTKRSTFGLGTAYTFGKGLIGVEYRYLKAELINNLSPAAPASNRDENGNQWSLGGEYNFSDALRWRLGYRYKNITSDPEGSTFPEADLTVSEISTGGDFRINNSLDLGLALWLANQKQDEAAAIQDEVELGTFGVQLMTRYHWGAAPPPPPPVP